MVYGIVLPTFLKTMDAASNQLSPKWLIASEK
jgi:hypothetical protein